ncbi:MAG: hypothetical protein HOW73_33010 [Polyangiaceae bacterium]|nr:hypothetical protein [Polyangiaceae bacterium]
MSDPTHVAAIGSTSASTSTSRTSLGGNRVAIQAAPRPDVVDTFDIDLESLPLARQSTEQGKSASFTLRYLADGSYQIGLTEELLVEVEVGPFRAFNGQHPSMQEAVEMSLFPDPPLLPCGASGPGFASWRGLRLSKWSEQTAEFVEHDGRFDPVACRGVAETTLTVDAASIWRSAIYAFRRCVEACAAPKHPSYREELVLIAPRAEWVVSTDERTPTRPHVGAFSRVALPLVPGRAAAALLHVTWRDLDDFTKMSGGSVRWKDLYEESARSRRLALSIEVDVPEHEAPRAMGFVSVVRFVEDESRAVR